MRGRRGLGRRDGEIFIRGCVIDWCVLLDVCMFCCYGHVGTGRDGGDVGWRYLVYWGAFSRGGRVEGGGKMVGWMGGGGGGMVRERGVGS